MSVNIIEIVREGVCFQAVESSVSGTFWNDVNQGFWEEETFRIFDRFLKPDQSYIDIGAWIGPTVLYGAHKAKQVYAIEPDPIAFGELTANLGLNPHLSSKIKSINAALSEEAGEIKLYKRHHFGDSTSSLIPTYSEEHFCRVKALPIEKLMEENTIENVGFIKMDIEGGEFKQVPFMQDYLQKNRPTFYVSLHPSFLEQNIYLTEKGKDGAAIKEEIVGKMLDSLQFYKRIYNAYGELTDRKSIEEAVRMGYFVSYVFTDDTW